MEQHVPFHVQNMLRRVNPDAVAAALNLLSSESLRLSFVAFIALNSRESDKDEDKCWPRVVGNGEGRSVGGKPNGRQKGEEGSGSDQET